MNLFIYRMPLAIRGGLLLLLVVAVLHTLDRQGEFVSRTDFLWKAKLKVKLSINLL
jgi:adenylate cyclase 2